MRPVAIFCLLAAGFGCAATRDAGDVRAGLAVTRAREPFLEPLPEAEARAAMPGYRGRAVPNLGRVAALLPETWQAEMAAWAALRREGTLSPRLLGEVFYVVSRANDCFY